MSLADYRKKRDFSTTREPQGRGGRKTGHSFVIQKHAARRLHYDLRLEMDGVLKSWAVSRGPSLVPGEKRLAVHVEDHPLDYRNFEGVIPEGQYGAGEVIVWDKGVWIPDGDPHKGYAKGHLDFELRGKKLGGRWHLVRMARKPREKHDNWLLIKSDDEYARAPDDEDILEEMPRSVKTGHTIGDVAEGRSKRPTKKGAAPKQAATSRSVKTGAVATKQALARDMEPSLVSGAKKAQLPNFIVPMQASAGVAPISKEWIHEIKFDGYRVQARIEAGRVRLLSRGGLDWTKKFGDEIVSALRALPLGSALIDGEIVVETRSGASDFSALQADLSAGRSDRFVYWVFDLLYLDGYDLRGAPLLERKGMLQRLLREENGNKVRLSVHFEDSGAVVLSHACRLGLEGVVSKLRDSPYRSGRAKSWVKAKCFARQEFVIAGYTPSTVSRRAIGALVLGVYQHGVLCHVGRVGTGFTADMAHELFTKLDPMRTPSSPFSARLSTEAARHVRYVRPELVAEVEFRGWTADQVLRHASFRGLRDDKQARDVVREIAPAMERLAAARVEKSAVTLTHPDRLYWPDQGVTKQGLADYYAEVWRYIAPFIVNRPLALLRCPNGVGGETFFQKHAWKGIDPNIVLIDDPKESEEEPLLSIKDLNGLIALVQSAALEIHPWGSTASDWERPDVIIMDLDPGEQVEWETVIAAAEETKVRLQDFGLTAFVKTSGGKGLHVMAPVKPKAEWPQVKAFTKSIADAMSKDSPGRFVSTITKSKRRGKILVDYLRNQRGATAVAPYSTRARPGASVSVPLAWDELSPAIGPAYFTIAKTLARLDSLKSDPWADFRQAAAAIEPSKPGRKKKT
ncbi:MAG: DNA ligase D [Alphaproteobacteria bacterium]|nr:DNA ligase D [Alphaproteobacteria bacterium]MBM3641560.1 DNA ligase D [Alphaproteobacteria bacterium]